jgi:competence protein ComEC
MADRHLVVLLTIGVLVGTVGCVGPGADTPADSAPEPAPSGTVGVHFINVGQSVSTLVVGPSGETMLIDTGDFTDDGRYVLEYLQDRKIDHIDHLVVSHNDADHIGGNAAVIEYYETQADGIGTVYDPGIAAATDTYDRYLDAIERHEVPLELTREGDEIRFANVTTRVLGPTAPYLANRERNENSLVLALTFGQTSFMFPGDAEDDQEAYLVDRYGSALQSTVLKAGHHGSKSSSSEAFLDAVDPQTVVISSSYDSRYGHPHEAVLDRLADRSIPTYWTGTHGTIVLTSDGRTVQIKTQREAPTDPSVLRDADPVEPGTLGGVQTRRVLTGTTTGVAGSLERETADETEVGGSLAIQELTADAPGDDRTNLNGETVVFTNTGETALDLSGWTVRDDSGRTYTVPNGTSIAPGETLTLYTGSGTNTQTALYWGSNSPIWNNDGDTVTVRTDDGTTVLTEATP